MALNVLKFITNTSMSVLRPSMLIKNNTIASTHCRYYSDKNEENSELVVVEQIDSIRLIGINRPHKRNCINTATATALLQAFKDFDNDENSKVAVLYGKGGTFCAGYDLSELSQAKSTDTLTENQGPMGPTRYVTSKPVIGAIDGYAVAGGFELALWCDVRLMEENAVMGVFCRRFGVPLMDGGATRLPRLIGLSRAMDIIMTGREVKVDEAVQIGLVARKTAVGSVLGQAVYYANYLTNYPQEALKADRLSAIHAFDGSVKEALIEEHKRALPSLKEAQEGATKFAVEKKGRGGFFFNHVPENINELDNY